ncbi:MAG TPA: helical backbone metal receptor [Micromonosporaceae bacterium]|nr:helical backbone metal receptor [Micromonosporaceae bacterium]
MTRVVSLVPSLTEAVAATAPGLLVGATSYCTHPADLDVPRVGGTKYPSVDAVLALRPDVVLANAEENRRPDVEAFRAAGVRVLVTYPRTLDGAFVELADMFDALGVPSPPWLAEAEAAWRSPPPAVVRRAVVPVWRRPWVVLGSDTFAGDLLARLGVANQFGGASERYPRPSLAEIRARGPELVVLPDEPYAFAADDGPEAFPGVPCALVSGRHLTWYGPSLVEARSLLTAQLASPTMP